MGKALTGVDQFMQLFDNGHLNGVGLSIAAGIFIGCAEKIGIKDRRHTIFTQQDQRIGQRLEPGFNRRLEGLQRLRIVVCHQRHGVKRVCFHQRAAEYLAHVIIAPLA